MKKLFILIMLISPLAKAQSSHSIKNNDTQHESASENTLGNNILSFTPIGIGTTSILNGGTDLTIGISYERISKNGLLGIKIPVHLSMYNPYYYFMPAIKIYPAKQGTAKYAIGPQLLIASGQVNTQGNYNTNTGNYNLISVDRKQFGFLLNNSFNFTLSKKLYVGLDLSLGIIYYDTAPDAIVNPNSTFFVGSSQSTSAVQPYSNIGFSMGYRF